MGADSLEPLDLLPAGSVLGPPQDVTFLARHDGTRQRYVEMLPSAFRSQDPHHLLVALHGHGADRWQFASDDRDECRAARDAAAAYGMIFVAPDYRAPASWMGPAAETDLVQIIGDMRQRHRVGRVILVGGSMGGTSALIFTALHSGLVAGTIALNGTANVLEVPRFADAIAASYGGTWDRRPEEYRRRCPALAPESFHDPIAFTVGGLDDVVPPDSVRRLAARLTTANSSVLLIDNADGGHATSYADSLRAITFVLDRALPTTGIRTP